MLKGQQDREQKAARRASLPTPADDVTPNRRRIHEFNEVSEKTSTKSFFSHTIFKQTVPKTTIKNHSNSRPLCTREQIQSGSWVDDILAKSPYISRNKHLRCLPEPQQQQPYSNHTNDREATFRSWTWYPADSLSTCEWTLWDAALFCHKMRHATLSIIGDSLSWEHYSSLLQLLGERVHQMDQHKSKSEKRNHKQRGCHPRNLARTTSGGATEVTSTVPGGSGSASFVFRNDPYLKHVNESIQNDFPLILVLNRGAHYVPDDVLLQDLRTITIPHLDQWQQTCYRMGVTCHLFWRTTVPGHVDCQTFSQPVNDLAYMERHVANLTLYTPLQLTYNWHHFRRQNELALQELQRSTLQYQVLDAYHLNLLRPDGHRIRDEDCLHSCYPGKMDVYNTLLLHFLRMERSEQDVEVLERKLRKLLERRNTSKNIRGRTTVAN